MALCKETDGWPDKYGNGAEVIEKFELCNE
jgi:hypothetical protein